MSGRCRTWAIGIFLLMLGMILLIIGFILYSQFFGTLQTITTGTNYTFIFPYLLIIIGILLKIIGIVFIFTSS